MRITRFGVQAGVFYLILVAGFFAAPYSNLFFLLLSFLTILWISGIAATRRNVIGVDAIVPDLHPVPTAEAVRIPALVRAGRRPRFQLELHLELLSGGSLVGHADLLEGQASIELRSEPLPRGIHRVTRLTVQSLHPKRRPRFRPRRRRRPRVRQR